MTPQQTLNAAADLLITHGWTQGAIALDAAGNPTKALSPTATCYCALGAVTKAAGGHQRVLLRALSLLTKRTGDVPTFNDFSARTKDEVINALRGTI